MYGSASAQWWREGPVLSTVDSCLATMHRAAQKSVPSTPSSVSQHLSIVRISQVWRDPVSKIEWNKTFRCSGNFDLQNGLSTLQFFISAPQSLLPPPFSTPQPGSAYVLFCASELCFSDQSLFFVSIRPACSLPFTYNPFGYTEDNTENVQDPCAFCSSLARLTYPLSSQAVSLSLLPAQYVRNTLGHTERHPSMLLA